MFLAQAGLQVLCLTASREMHNSVLRQLLDGSMAFFHSNPVGRVLNRMAKDVDVCDTQLPFSLEQTVTGAFITLSVVVACAVVFPLSLVTIPFLVVGFLILASYLR